MATVEGEMDDTSVAAAVARDVDAEVVEHRAELADVEESRGRACRTLVRDAVMRSGKLALRAVAREEASQAAV